MYFSRQTSFPTAGVSPLLRSAGLDLANGKVAISGGRDYGVSWTTGEDAAHFSDHTFTQGSSPELSGWPLRIEGDNLVSISPHI